MSIFGNAGFSNALNADSVSSDIQKLKEEKLQTLSSKKSQLLNGSNLDPNSFTEMEDGSIESNKNKIWNDYSQNDLASTLSYAVSNYGIQTDQQTGKKFFIKDGERVDYNGPTERVYMFGTKGGDGFTKIGLARGDLPGAEYRYQPGKAAQEGFSVGKNGYGWESGMFGVDTDNKLFDVEMPANVATVLEGLYHGNKSNLADRAGASGDELTKSMLGGGYTEYYKNRESLIPRSNSQGLSFDQARELLDPYVNQQQTNNPRLGLVNPEAQAEANRRFVDEFEADHMGVLGRAANTVKGVGKAIAQNLFLDTADWVGETLNRQTDGKVGWDIGNEKEKAQMASSLFGYNQVLAERGQEEATKYVKNLWQAATKDNVDFKFSDALGLMKTVLTTPELIGESVGYMYSMLPGWGLKALKVATEGEKALAGAKAAFASLDDVGDAAAKAEKAKEIAALTTQVAVHKQQAAMGNAVRALGLTNVATGDVNDQIDEYTKNNNGVPPTAAHILTTMMPVAVVATALDKLSFSYTTGAFKSPTKEAIDATKEVVETVPEAAKASLFAKSMGVAGQLAKAGAVEAAQEYTQTMAEIFNKQYDTAKYGDDVSNILTDEHNIVGALTGAAFGAGMGAQMKAGGMAIGSIGSALADNVESKKEEAKQNTLEAFLENLAATGHAKIHNDETAETSSASIGGIISNAGANIYAGITPTNGSITDADVTDNISKIADNTANTIKTDYMLSEDSKTRVNEILTTYLSSTHKLNGMFTGLVNNHPEHKEAVQNYLNSGDNAALDSVTDSSVKERIINLKTLKDSKDESVNADIREVVTANKDILVNSSKSFIDTLDDIAKAAKTREEAYGNIRTKIEKIAGSNVLAATPGLHSYVNKLLTDEPTLNAFVDAHYKMGVTEALSRVGSALNQAGAGVKQELEGIKGNPYSVSQEAQQQQQQQQPSGPVQSTSSVQQPVNTQATAGTQPQTPTQDSVKDRHALAAFKQIIPLVGKMQGFTTEDGTGSKTFRDALTNIKNNHPAVKAEAINYARGVFSSPELLAALESHIAAVGTSNEDLKSFIDFAISNTGSKEELNAAVATLRSHKRSDVVEKAISEAVKEREEVIEEVEELVNSLYKSAGEGRQDDTGKGIIAGELSRHLLTDDEQSSNYFKDLDSKFVSIPAHLRNAATLIADGKRDELPKVITALENFANSQSKKLPQIKKAYKTALDNIKRVFGKADLSPEQLNDFLNDILDGNNVDDKKTFFGVGSTPFDSGTEKKTSTRALNLDDVMAMLNNEAKGRSVLAGARIKPLEGSVTLEMLGLTTGVDELYNHTLLQEFQAVRGKVQSAAGSVLDKNVVKATYNNPYGWPIRLSGYVPDELAAIIDAQNVIKEHMVKPNKSTQKPTSQPTQAPSEEPEAPTGPTEPEGPIPPEGPVEPEAPNEKLLAEAEGEGISVKVYSNRLSITPTEGGTISISSYATLSKALEDAGLASTANVVNRFHGVLKALEQVKAAPVEHLLANIRGTINIPFEDDLTLAEKLGEGFSKRLKGTIKSKVDNNASIADAVNAHLDKINAQNNYLSANDKLDINTLLDIVLTGKGKDENFRFDLQGKGFGGSQGLLGRLTRLFGALVQKAFGGGVRTSIEGYVTAFYSVLAAIDKAEEEAKKPKEPKQPKEPKKGKTPTPEDEEPIKPTPEPTTPPKPTPAPTSKPTAAPTEAPKPTSAPTPAPAGPTEDGGKADNGNGSGKMYEDESARASIKRLKEYIIERNNAAKTTIISILGNLYNSKSNEEDTKILNAAIKEEYDIMREAGHITPVLSVNEIHNVVATYLQNKFCKGS